MTGLTWPGMESEAASVRTYLEELSGGGRFQGSVLLVHDGQNLVDSGFGFANRSEHRWNEPQTIFQIASVSKQFTAAAILWLQERNRISVNDPISKWIPGCPKAWELITIHHLLTHTGGISHWPDLTGRERLSHWRDLPGLNSTHPPSRADFIRLFQSRPLKFRPGEGWSYSSPAYMLLAHIVEALTGEAYLRFLHRVILDPLELRDTLGWSDPQPTGRLAQGYRRGEPVPPIDLDLLMVGAGDLFSTTHDLKKWDEALSSPGRLLSAPSLDLMFKRHARVSSPSPGTSGSGPSYGYGWFLDEVEGIPIQYHPGDNPGFKSINVRLVDRDAAVILLSNDDANAVGEIGESVTTMVAARWSRSSAH